MVDIKFKQVPFEENQSVFYPLCCFSIFFKCYPPHTSKTYVSLYQKECKQTFQFFTVAIHVRFFKSFKFMGIGET